MDLATRYPESKGIRQDAQKLKNGRTGCAWGLLCISNRIKAITPPVPFKGYFYQEIKPGTERVEGALVRQTRSNLGVWLCARVQRVIRRFNERARLDDQDPDSSA